ncbi:hypothetical protein [Bacillus sp. SM2101]|uniref:hypothetical protein n=1 Tax=Bacillus sp. SM2101 TaxID=2805366 RepID=UPI001BDDDD01|nr:hypothetical protein [Bacillus sp. SM2101]
MIYSWIIGLLLFFTTAILPEAISSKSMNIEFPKWSFIILTSLFLIVIKDKWWIKTLSVLFSLVVSIALIVLLVP